ncbi:SigE family RNA polymerase sigma factor [Nocardioides sp.]|uniref:SigE family RNA polymerase sigma factor n=1 Tax=Nocardioides sp. TaxID=35761 RepID=UPI00262D70FC|nr:SigE family RNA polymerase sigma factor [Nocardioides sp.]MCW2735768.1 polymerase, sigma-24 subunit, subfamily [Nocardioides sp.]
MKFEDYVAARGRALERYAYVLTGDAQASEDLVQTALVKAYTHWRWVERADQPDLYVRRIVTTTFLDGTRRRSSSERPVADVPDRGSDPAHDPAHRVVVRDELSRALARLTPQQRAVLVLRHFEGYDDMAIAKVLGCSTSTVRSHCSRGLDGLRTYLRSEQEAGET